MGYESSVIVSSWTEKGHRGSMYLEKPKEELKSGEGEYIGIP